MLLSWKTLFFAISVLACVASSAKPARPTKPAVRPPTLKPARNATNSKLLNFAYIVSIELKFPRSRAFVHTCSGSIISPKTILTAASCIRDKPKGTRMRIVAGTQESRTNKNKNRQYISVLKTLSHPKYSEKTNANDIALLSLVQPLKMTAYSKMIILPKFRSQALKRNLSRWTLLSGWGTIAKKPGASAQDVLQTSTVPLLSEKHCLRILKIIKNRDPQTKNKLFSITNNLCTGAWKRRISYCNADAGSPLVKDRILVGIASWTGAPCGKNNQPMIYTNVAQYIDFVERHVIDLPKLA